MAVVKFDASSELSWPCTRAKDARAWMNVAASTPEFESVSSIAQAGDSYTFVPRGSSWWIRDARVAVEFYASATGALRSRMRIVGPEARYTGLTNARGTKMSQVFADPL